MIVRDAYDFEGVRLKVVVDQAWMMPKIPFQSIDACALGRVLEAEDPHKWPINSAVTIDRRMDDKDIRYRVREKVQWLPGEHF